MPPTPSVSSPRSGLLSFRATNERSFRDGFSVSLLATTLADPGSVRTVPLARGKRSVRLLPSIAIYGANASGKSNVLKAINALRLHIERSFRFPVEEGTIVERSPFRLDDDSESRPTSYEIEAIIESVPHTYGFTLNDNEYLTEWAYHYPNGRQATLFYRDGLHVTFGPQLRAEGRHVQRLLRPTSLLLSAAAAATFRPLMPLHDWIFPRFRLAQEGNRRIRQQMTIDMLEDKQTAERILGLIRAADLGIVSISKTESTEFVNRALAVLNREFFADVPEELRDAVASQAVELSLPLEVMHQGRNKVVPFAEPYESKGTLVWIGVLGWILRALSEGLVLLVDELDGSLHPALIEQLLRLFRDPVSNPHGAQLIFTTHDANLLGDSSNERIIGRDQAWFVEKDGDGSSRLYSLADLAPRKEEAIARRYLAGRYGAVPILSRADFRAAVTETHANGHE